MDIHHGTVCTFIPDKGWGLVAEVLDKGTHRETVNRYWFHASKLKRDPTVGMLVSFTISRIRGGKYLSIETMEGM
jgi:hypothetical protein